MNAQCEDRMLRKAFIGNALFSTVSGLIILFGQRWVLRILGLSNINLYILGGALIVFATTLAINARKQKLKISDAWTAVVMDLAWVVGSGVLILTVPFSVTGKWIVGAVAELVLLFAVLQFVGLRRIQKAAHFA